MLSISLLGLLLGITSWNIDSKFGLFLSLLSFLICLIPMFYVFSGRTSHLVDFSNYLNSIDPKTFRMIAISITIIAVVGMPFLIIGMKSKSS